MSSTELDFRRDIDPNTIYELSSLLGEGSYGAVYKASVRDSSQMQADVAIKIIPDADDDLTSLWREIRFLQVLRSPFVVSFIESLLYDNELWLVMELCDGGSLFELKEARKTFNEEELRAIIAFSTLGLAHLHSQRSIHRDVKSANILLTKDGRAKLGDFGISAQLTDTIMKRRTVIGSPYWMAPEVIQETSYDGKADIWSLGITLLELCEGAPPHFSVHPMRAIFIISSRAAPILKEPDRWSPDMKDFVSLCLVKDCEQRATAAELLKHPWLKRTVKEIGSHGQGLPILRNLVIESWDEMERLRLSKYQVPAEEDEANGDAAAAMIENLIPKTTTTTGTAAAGAIDEKSSFDEDGGATMRRVVAPVVGSSTNNTASTSFNGNITNSSSAAAIGLGGGGGGGGGGDERTLRTNAAVPATTTAGVVNRLNQSLSGVPATRQQLRNRSLTPTNLRTSLQRPSSAVFIHNRGSLSASNNSHSEAIAEPKGRKHVSVTKFSSSVGTLELHRDSKQDSKNTGGEYKRGMPTHAPTTGTGTNYESKNDMRDERDDINNVSNMEGASSVHYNYTPDRARREVVGGGGSLIRTPPTTGNYDPEEENPTNSGGGEGGGSLVVNRNQQQQQQQQPGGLAAALKYFRNDQPNVGPTETTITSRPSPNVNTNNNNNNNNNNVHSGNGSSSLVRKLPDLPPGAMIPTSSSAAAEAAAASSSTAGGGGGGGAIPTAIEDSLLHDLVAEEDSQNLFIKKEIMKQLSSLKKQYREDLEELTRAYEQRRLLLKEALLMVSDTTNNTSSTAADANNNSSSTQRTQLTANPKRNAGIGSSSRGVGNVDTKGYR